MDSVKIMKLLVFFASIPEQRPTEASITQKYFMKAHDNGEYIIYLVLRQNIHKYWKKVSLQTP